VWFKLDEGLKHLEEIKKEFGLTYSDKGKPQFPTHIHGGWMQLGGQQHCFLGPCNRCPRVDVCNNELALISLAGETTNIRRAFIAEEGYNWVSIDFKGIELVISTNLSREPVWMDALLNKADLHKRMASLTFKVSEDQVKKDMRSQAKACNFANLYGAKPFTFSRQSGLPLAEATSIWEGWWSAVPILNGWCERCKLEARQTGVVETHFGRKRHIQFLLNEIAEHEQHNRYKEARQTIGFLDRTAVNTKVQGTGADIVKIAAYRVSQGIKKEKLEKAIRLKTIVHDEIDFEVKKGPEFEDLCLWIAKQMVFPIAGWAVPLEVDIEYGNGNPSSWGELTDLKVKPQSAPIKDSPIVVKEQYENSTVEDCCILHVNAQLTAELAKEINTAIMTSPGSQKLYLMVAGQTYRTKTASMVDQLSLTNKLANCKGLMVKDGKGNISEKLDTEIP